MSAGEHIGILKTKYPEGDEHEPLAGAICWMLTKMEFKTNGNSFFSYEGKFGSVRAGGVTALVLIIVTAIVILTLHNTRVINLPTLGNAIEEHTGGK